MGHRHVLGVLECQTLDEDAPCLGLSALGATHGGHPVHLKRHESSIDLAEQPFTDPKDDIWPMHAVIDRYDQRCTVLGNSQVPMPVFFGADRKKAATLGQRQNLGAPVIDPHGSMINGLRGWPQGSKVHSR